MSDTEIDKNKLQQAVGIANIKSFIEGLPLSYNTKIGAEGMGLSTGQKQRILIARAIYKNPEYLFFDEATSALDAKNEKEIMENLKKEAPIEEPYIAVHFRNTDRKNEIAPFIEQIKKVRDEENIHVLYLASDDFFAYERMKEHFDGMRIIRKVIPIKGVKNIHYFKIVVYFLDSQFWLVFCA